MDMSDNRGPKFSTFEVLVLRAIKIILHAVVFNDKQHRNADQLVEEINRELKE